MCSGREMDRRAWGPQPQLTDGVVLLTRFREEDTRTIVEWDHDPDIARWFDFPPLPPEYEHLERVRGVIAAWHKDYAAGSRIAWAVRDPTTERPLGSVELRPREDGAADVSYATHPAQRGRGFATRAL